MVFCGDYKGKLHSVIPVSNFINFYEPRKEIFSRNSNVVHGHPSIVFA